jgi:hypothetical protein
LNQRDITFNKESRCNVIDSSSDGNDSMQMPVFIPRQHLAHAVKKKEKARKNGRPKAETKKKSRGDSLYANTISCLDGNSRYQQQVIQRGQCCCLTILVIPDNDDLFVMLVGIVKDSKWMWFQKESSSSSVNFSNKKQEYSGSALEAEQELY